MKFKINDNCNTFKRKVVFETKHQMIKETRNMTFDTGWQMYEWVGSRLYRLEQQVLELATGNHKH